MLLMRYTQSIEFLHIICIFIQFTFVETEYTFVEFAYTFVYGDLHLLIYICILVYGCTMGVVHPPIYPPRPHVKIFYFFGGTVFQIILEKIFYNNILEKILGNFSIIIFWKKNLIIIPEKKFNI